MTVAISRKMVVRAIVSESVNHIIRKKRITSSKGVRNSDKCSLLTFRGVE